MKKLLLILTIGSFFCRLAIGQPMVIDVKPKVAIKPAWTKARTIPTKETVKEWLFLYSKDMEDDRVWKLRSETTLSELGNSETDIKAIEKAEVAGWVEYKSSLVFKNRIKYATLLKASNKFKEHIRWYSEQLNFYDEWKAGNVQGLVNRTEVKELEFFTAYGSQIGFEDIKSFELDSDFDYRFYLVNKISPDWEDIFKPQGEFILVINYGLNNAEIQALMCLIEKYESKIVFIQIGYEKSEVNNYDNRYIPSYQYVAGFLDKIAFDISGKFPEIPIILTVCVVEETYREWLSAFKFPYDGLALWNIDNIYKAKLQKVFNMFSGYNQNLILAGIFQSNIGKGERISFSELKKITTQADIQKVKDIGFKGIVFIRTNK